MSVIFAYNIFQTIVSADELSRLCCLVVSVSVFVCSAFFGVFTEFVLIFETNVPSKYLKESQIIELLQNDDSLSDFDIDFGEDGSDNLDNGIHINDY